MTRHAKPYGMFPTPWGVAVEVHKVDPPDPSDPEAVVFTAEAVAVCAGIHDKRQRDEFVRISKGTGFVPLERVPEFGGFAPLPRVPLIPPPHSCYNDTPNSGPVAVDGASCREIVDRWVDRVTARHRWCDRADELLDLVVGQMDGLARDGGSRRLPSIVVGFPLSVMITSVLENLGEDEIDCIEAAAWYALAAHDEWRATALTWLEPIRATWWKDWIGQRQGYRRAAHIMADVYDAMPPWLYGRGL